MPESSAQRALAASAATLLLALAAIAMFLPPLVAHTTASVVRTVATALLLGTSVLLHWAFLGIGARRMGRSVGFWAGAMGVLLFPIGGAAALMLLSWFASEGGTATPAPHRG